ncbi:MAG: hypothetical protein ACFFCW_28510 [Candidatus Hodarchaeota archaeon]
MNKQIFRHAWGVSIRSVYLMYIRGSPLLLLAVGLYFTITLFQNFSKDTTAITNVAFAFVASLAALSFSCARAIDKPLEHKDRFTYAGERYFHAAILFLMASVIKYALLSLLSNEWVSGHEWLVRGLRFWIGTFVGVLFFWALMSAHTALKVINDLLWSRFSRHPDWDDIV